MQKPADTDDKLTITRREAAERLSVSQDTFVRHIEPRLRVVKVGYGKRTMTLIPVTELNRWVSDQTG